MMFKINKVMLVVIAIMMTIGGSFILILNAFVWGALTYQQTVIGISEFMWSIATGGALTMLIGVMTYEPKKEEAEEELVKFEI